MNFNCITVIVIENLQLYHQNIDHRFQSPPQQLHLQGSLKKRGEKTSRKVQWWYSTVWAFYSSVKIPPFCRYIAWKKIKIIGKWSYASKWNFRPPVMVSLENELDLKQVLTDPLTPIRYGWHYLQNWQVCALKNVGASGASKEPEDADAIVYDGYFMIHFIKEIPISLGNISQNTHTVVVAYEP